MKSFLLVLLCAIIFAIVQVQSEDLKESQQQAADLQNDAGSIEFLFEDGDLYDDDELLEEEADEDEENLEDDDDGLQSLNKDQYEYFVILDRGYPNEEDDAETGDTENLMEENMEEDVPMSEINDDLWKVIDYLLKNNHMTEDDSIEIIDDDGSKEMEGIMEDDMNESGVNDELCMPRICPRMYVPLCVLKNGVKTTMPSPCVYSNRVRCDMLKHKLLGRSAPVYEVLSGGTCEEPNTSADLSDKMPLLSRQKRVAEA